MIALLILIAIALILGGTIGIKGNGAKTIFYIVTFLALFFGMLGSFGNKGFIESVINCYMAFYIPYFL